MSSSVDINKTYKIIMLLLAAYPILGIYKSPISVFSWGDLLLLVAMVASVCANGVKKSFSYPKYYKLYWSIVAINYIIISHLKISSFIPGGFSFALFSLMLGFSIPKFNFSVFIKYFRIIFVIAAVVLFLQEVCYYALGYRFSVLIPFGRLMDDVPIDSLIFEHMFGARSCSLFREPAHFAQFALPLLAIELFKKENTEKLFTPFSIFIILTLVVLRSGNGFVGLMLLVFIKVWYFLIKTKNKHRFVIMGVALFASIVLIGRYVQTEAGSGMLERVSEMENDEDAASYIRIYRGFRVFEELPPANKLIGISQDNLLKVIYSSSVSFLFSGDKQYDLYFNGIQNSLMSTGLMGTIMLLIVFFQLCKNNSILAKTNIFLFVVMSFLGQIFLSFFMMISIIIAFEEKAGVKQIEL